MRRVVITGIGAVTPLDNSFAESWEAILAGRSGISTITRFSTEGLPWKVAGEVRGSGSGITHRERLRLDPFAQYAVSAAFSAFEEARLADSDEAYLKAGGVVIGSSRGGISSIQQALEGRRRRPSAFLMPSTTVGMAPASIAERFGMMGHCMGISNACASGTNAVGEAYRLLKSGYPGPVLAGGSDAAVCPICLEGYGATRALSRRCDPSASRPFDRTRDGFVLAEGSCVLVLEGLDEALKRNAGVHGEIIGYATSADAYHPTRPRSAGQAMAISAAIADAGLRPDEISFISAHATATVLGDEAEFRALEQVFGKRAGTVPVSALKSATGHMLAASGAFETAAAVRALKEGIIPPTLNLTGKDPGCPVNASLEPRTADLQTGLSQSFGFGGVNAVIVLRRWRGQTDFS